MSLLVPSAPFGVLLLAVPVLVHLFKPRKTRPIPFSSLRWLKATRQRLTRRIQWHQWLLFLCRAGVIALLVLALARPIIGSRDASPVADRVLLLDVSRSMAYQLPGAPSSWESARDVARGLLRAPRPGQFTAVLAVDTQPRLLKSFEDDLSRGLAEVEGLQPGYADTHLSSALPIVERLVQSSRSRGRPLELIVLTDLQQGSWQQPGIRALVEGKLAPAQVRVVDVGPGNPANAWIASARVLDLGLERGHLLVAEVGSVGSAAGERSIRLTGVAGLADEVQPLKLQPGRNQRVAFRLPPGTMLDGQVAVLRLEPADALPSDDTLYVPLDRAGATRVLLVEPETSGADGRPVGLFIRAALAALDANQKETLDVAVKPVAAVAAEDIRRAEVVVLAGAVALPATALASLETQVRAGAGLIVFVGPSPAVDFFNQRLHRPLQPAEGLTPFALTGTLRRQTSAPSGLIDAQRQHPLLAGFFDPVHGGLADVRFRAYAQLQGAAGPNDQVLARFQDGTPALVDHPLGAGRVLLVNTSANDEWSDLPARRSFVPLLDRMIGYLSRGGQRRSFVAGEPVRLALPDWPAAVAVEITLPSGKKLSAMPKEIQNQVVLALDEIAEPGVTRSARRRQVAGPGGQRRSGGQPPGAFRRQAPARMVGTDAGGHPHGRGGAAPLVGRRIAEAALAVVDRASGLVARY